MGFVFWLKRLPWGDIVRGLREAAPAAMDFVRDWQRKRHRGDNEGADPLAALEQRLTQLEQETERQGESLHLLHIELQTLRNHLNQLRRLVLLTLLLTVTAVIIGIVTLVR
ncbi:MAG TPA: hypothetical protein VFR01_04525 [Geobacterales bacterium]|nr:hypothetical protein [Geobacterales bacterium]